MKLCKCLAPCQPYLPPDDFGLGVGFGLGFGFGFGFDTWLPEKEPKVF